MAVIGLYTFQSPNMGDEWHGIGTRRSWVPGDHEYLWHVTPEGFDRAAYRKMADELFEVLAGRQHGKSMDVIGDMDPGFELFNEINSQKFWSSWQA